MSGRRSTSPSPGRRNQPVYTFHEKAGRLLLLCFGQMVDQKSGNLQMWRPLAGFVALLMSIRPLFYYRSCWLSSQVPVDNVTESSGQNGTCMQSRATQTTLAQWSMDHAVAYSLEGVAWVGAFVCCSFYLTNFEYKTEIAAQEQVLHVSLLPTGRQAHRGARVDLKDLWWWGSFVIFALFLSQFVCGCYVYAFDPKYENDSRLVLVLLHFLFYFPVFSLQALWVGTCGELAARTSALMRHVEILFEEGDLQKKGCRSHSQQQCFIYLREQMRLLHEDAREQSIWWMPFALICLVSNCFYISYRSTDYSPGDLNGDGVDDKFDASKISGMLRMLSDSLFKGDLRAAGILWPLFSSILQIAAVEVLPNRAHRNLQSTIKEKYANRHKAKSTDMDVDEAWKDMWEMAQAHCFTFRFPVLGEYSFLNIIKCKAFQELLVNPKDLGTMLSKMVMDSPGAD